jgi:hypothetical protein
MLELVHKYRVEVLVLFYHVLSILIVLHLKLHMPVQSVGKSVIPDCSG